MSYINYSFGEPISLGTIIFDDLYSSSFNNFKYFCNNIKLYKTRTFAATGNRPLSLSPRGSARLLWCFLDVRNVRIVEVQGERVGHGYGKTGGNHYR